MRIEKSLMAITTIATAFLVAIPMTAFRRLPSQKPATPVRLLDEGPHPEPPSELPEEHTIAAEDDSAAGGPVVVLSLFALVGVVGLFASAFIFPPAYVAAGITFGSVSVLGLMVLYVHFRAHASTTAASKIPSSSETP